MENEHGQTFEKIRRRSISSYNVFVLFYVFLHILTLSDLFYFSDNFLTQHSFAYHFSFFTFTIIAAVLYFKVKKEPGYITNEIPISPPQTNSNESVEIKDINNALLETDSKTESTPSNRKIDITNVEAIKAKINSFIKNCDICKTLIPLRGKHCKRCGKCVRKFDHHCFFVGGCIGESNHLLFMTYLFFQTISMVFAFSTVNS